MQNRASYCCGKWIRRVDGLAKGDVRYECPRCERELTVYGNPKHEEDKQAYKRATWVDGRGHKVLPDGSLELIKVVYPFADENTVSDKLVHINFAIFDEYGTFVTSIKLEHTTGHVYEVLDPFENRLKKERLLGIPLQSLTSLGYTVAGMQRDKTVRVDLSKFGFKVKVRK